MMKKEIPGAWKARKGIEYAKISAAVGYWSALEGR